MSRFELGPVALRAKLEPGPSQHRAGMLVEPLARRLPASIEVGTLALRTIVGAGTALRFRSVLP